MTEICGAITFLFEEVTDTSLCLDMNCLLNILSKYYDAENKKDNINNEILNQINLPIERMFKETSLAHDYIYVSKAYIIDLYETRENYCGPQYKAIMDKWLPKGLELDNLKNILRLEGIEK